MNSYCKYIENSLFTSVSTVYIFHMNFRHTERFHHEGKVSERVLVLRAKVISRFCSFKYLNCWVTYFFRNRFFRARKTRINKFQKNSLYKDNINIIKKCNITAINFHLISLKFLQSYSYYLIIILLYDSR